MKYLICIICKAESTFSKRKSTLLDKFEISSNDTIDFKWIEHVDPNTIEFTKISKMLEDNAKIGVGAMTTIDGSKRDIYQCSAEIACSLAHLKAWEQFEGYDYAFVFEGDTEPVYSHYNLKDMLSPISDNVECAKTLLYLGGTVLPSSRLIKDNEPLRVWINYPQYEYIGLKSMIVKSGLLGAFAYVVNVKRTKRLSCSKDTISMLSNGGITDRVLSFIYQNYGLAVVYNKPLFSCYNQNKSCIGDYNFNPMTVVWDLTHYSNGNYRYENRTIIIVLSEYEEESNDFLRDNFFEFGKYENIVVWDTPMNFELFNKYQKIIVSECMKKYQGTIVGVIHASNNKPQKLD